MTIERSLLSSCSWIDTHLTEFEIRAGISFEGVVTSLKAVAELAHAADFLLRSSQSTSVEFGKRWMDFAWDQMRQGELIRKLLLKDHRLFPIAATYLPFHLVGLQNDELGETIAERLPLAVMNDASWSLMIPALLAMKFQIGHELEEKAHSRSVLSNKTMAASLSDDDFYILMHECLYATAWGRHPIPHDPEGKGYLASILPELVARSLDNADLLAEAILVSHLVTPACVEPQAWEALKYAQAETGNVVSPDPVATEFPRIKHPALGRTYHTTIAAILAWSACLSRCLSRRIPA